MTATKASKPRKPKKEPHERPLDARQRRFAEFVASGKGNVEAYRLAGYKVDKISPNALRVNACRLASRANIALIIDDLRAKVKAIAEDRYLVTQERIVAELASIAFHNASDFFEWSDDGVTLTPSSELTPRQLAVVASVSETKGKSPKIEVKLSDKQSALLALGRTLAMFKDKSELSGPDGAAIKVETTPLSDDDAARVIAFALAKAQQKPCA